MNRLDSDLLNQLAEFMLAPEGYPERLHRLAFPVAPGGTLTANVSTLSETGQLLAIRALMAWTEVTGIRFELLESDDADIEFSDPRNNFSASTSMSYKNGVITSATVYISATVINDSGGSIASFAFEALVHEIGHALGLNHPGIYPIFAEYGVDNTFTNDSSQTSAMSYFSQTSNTDLDASYAIPVTPMIADIIALHDLYGVPVLRAGDTIYGVGSNIGGHLGALLTDLTAGELDGPVTFTLFDSGGTDTLNFSTDTDDQHVVLQPETASDVYGLVGNLVIARNTLIENYVAGAGDDIIVGNEADNVLEGSAGADDIDGDAGLDTASYAGSSTAVTVNLSDGTASGGDAEGDSFTSIENLSGSAFDDTLIGDSSDNVLEGGDGAIPLMAAPAPIRRPGQPLMPQLQLTSPPARIPVGTRQAILSPLSKTCWAPATQMCSPVMLVPTGLTVGRATTALKAGQGPTPLWVVRALTRPLMRPPRLRSRSTLRQALHQAGTPKATALIQLNTSPAPLMTTP